MAAPDSGLGTQDSRLAGLSQWEKWQEFSREFIRVNFDKAVLVGGLVFFWKLGDKEMMKACMVGLAVSINHNRFRWNP